MKIGLNTDSLGNLGFDEVLKKCSELGIDSVELGSGNWSSAPHMDLDRLITDEEFRKMFLEKLEKYNIHISALTCSGNQLAPGNMGKTSDEVVRKTFKLAELIDIKKIVMMSGLPGGGPEDKYPNWVVTSWPPETTEILKWQWEKVAIPYWKEIVKVAENHGIQKLALEHHGGQLVYNVETFLRLRNETSSIVGFNLDPSHLFWMGGDPLAVIRKLKGHIYHVHAKDVRIEKIPAGYNTLLDGKTVDQFSTRSWNFAIPGYGHDELWWKEFVTLLRMQGYDDVLSIENEDYTMGMLTALEESVAFLKRIIKD